MTKGLIIAGTHSGAGKTTLTLGLMAAFHRRGLSVAPFKVGPDFIDPGYHAQVAGHPSRNLDGWMLSQSCNQKKFIDHSMESDVAVVEGVMGLFDGISGNSEAGSTAQMAKWLHLPVLLVVSAASMARSAAAMVRGFERFDPHLRFAGVVFNHLGSSGHLTYVQDAMAAYVDMPVLGGLLRNDDIRIPERHLGLTTARERPLTQGQIALLADHIEAGIDLDQLLEGVPEIQGRSSENRVTSIDVRPSKVRVGVAQDHAFCFYYPENLELLADAGAEIVTFSPLEDKMLPDHLHGIYLGGGYPELYADRLADNHHMRTAIRNHSLEGMPIYAECGGFMYLCRQLEDGNGKTHPMCNCFDLQSRMNAKLRTLGYRSVRLCSDTILGNKGDMLRGHEFHYSDVTGRPVMQGMDTVYEVEARKGSSLHDEGYLVHQTLGSYIHLHFDSHPACARAFVAACRQYFQKRKKVHEAP